MSMSPPMSKANLCPWVILFCSNHREQFLWEPRAKWKIQRLQPLSYKQLQNVERELRLLGPSSFSKPDSYNQAVLQVQGMKNLLKPQVSSCSISGLHTRSSSPTEGNSGDSKKCCQKGLPCWFVFVGWFLVVATSGVSAYFTMIMGWPMGRSAPSAGSSQWWCHSSKASSLHSL